MAHGDAREGKWRGNWRMEWLASTLTLPWNMVYPALLPLMCTPRLPVVGWTDAPRRFKWIRPFRRKTKSSFCACAITFQTQSTAVSITNHSQAALWSKALTNSPSRSRFQIRWKMLLRKFLQECPQVSAYVSLMFGFHLSDLFLSILTVNEQYLKRLIALNTKLTSDKRRQMSVKICDTFQGNNGPSCTS